MKEQKSSSFYIGIEDPRELRRNTLEASKSVIGALQKQQRILDIQTEKAVLKQKLKDDIKEIKMLFSNLEKILPENIFDINTKSKPKAEEKTNIDIPKQVPSIKSKKTEIDRLHANLDIIEERLKNLDIKSK